MFVDHRSPIFELGCIRELGDSLQSSSTSVLVGTCSILWSECSLMKSRRSDAVDMRA
jgi:hypothetical protein